MRLVGKEDNIDIYNLLVINVLRREKYTTNYNYAKQQTTSMQ